MDVLPEDAPGPSPAAGSRLPLEPPGSGALATRRICPYLTIEGGGWRSAHPAKEHRCGAVTPAALLATDKQRRLCLIDAHRMCATFVAARRQASGGEAASGSPGDGAAQSLAPAGRNAAADEGATVTRWSLVRTAPVVLDQQRVPVRLGSLARARTQPQLMLGGLMVVAFLAIALTRLPGPSTPAVTTDSPRPSGTAAAASPSPTSSPTPRPTPRPSPSTAASARPTTPAQSPSPQPAGRSYTVRAGDTLYAIALRFGTTVRAIQDANGMGNSANLDIGRVLRIP